MKFILSISFALVTNAVSAQTLQHSDVKTLLQKSKAQLEKVEPGMTKKVVSTMMSENCTFRITSTDVVLKIEDSKAVIFSKEKFQPQNTQACQKLGYTGSSEQDYLYFEAKPSLALEIEDLDSLKSSIKKIVKSGNIITMNIALTTTDENGQSKTENVTNKYDLTKTIFDYGISSQSVNYSTTTETLPKTDLKTISLKSVIFCDNTIEDDENGPECVEGDFSDILF